MFQPRTLNKVILKTPSLYGVSSVHRSSAYVHTTQLRTFYHKAKELPYQWQHRLDVWNRYVDAHVSTTPSDPVSAAATLVKTMDTKQRIAEEKPADLTITLVVNGETLTVPGCSYISTPRNLLPRDNPAHKTAIACLINGKLHDLTYPLESSCTVEFIDFDHPLGKDTLWHSSAHILGEALEFNYPNAKTHLSDGPPLDNGGFFYDVYVQDSTDTSITVSNDQLRNIEKHAMRVVKDKQPFQRLLVDIPTAREMFKDNTFKLETLDMIERKSDDKYVTLYKNGPFIDLCRGPHIPNTNMANSFKLLKTSSSLLKSPLSFPSSTPGSSTSVSIQDVQRVYGISFPNADLLKEYEEFLARAEQADHRRIGRVQNLFMFHPYSPGVPFFLPHGTRIYNRLVEFLRREYVKRGYEEVRTPQIFDKKLWEKSGHWENYAEDMFYVSNGRGSVLTTDGSASGANTTANGPTLVIPEDLKPEELTCTNHTPLDNHTHTHTHTHTHAHNVTPTTPTTNNPLTCENAQQALKPMNCPGHCLLFGSTLRSYRDLPLRIADFSNLHRNEISGALSGLTRVRAFAQDDAHIFCTPEQLSQELVSCIEFIQYIYNDVFKLPLSYKLSTRPDNYIGDINTWDSAESTLKDLLSKSNLDWELNEGDGAFYGPKVDVSIKDALGRYHQCATIQLDFNLPQRFGLKYKHTDGNEYTPVMIHRAILGSLERFMAILLEHTLGKLPLWLSPRQVFISIVTDAQVPYAEQVHAMLKKHNIYADLADTSLRITKQVKMAQPYQYNYIVTIGAEEMANGTVSIRPRGAFAAEPEPMKIEDFIARIEKEIQEQI